MATQMSADEKAALDLFLAEWDGVDQEVSTLEAGLRDARVTMAQGNALWLAALGYLVTFELVGASVARRRTKYPDRSTSTARFTTGAREFAARRVSRQIAAALWSLRCGLAHEYGLRNQQRYVFLLAQDGPLVRRPRRRWDGTAAEAVKRSVQTRVNVRALGDLVEDVVANVRELHRAGQIVLAPHRTVDDLRTFGRFHVS